mgnify:CR=1 FL=1
MEANFECKNISCSFPGEGQFKMKLNFEAIMDKNNVATLFCPFCKEPMVAAADHLPDFKEAAVDAKGVNSLS